MEIGDLVRVTGRAFTGIGYIKGFGRYGNSYVLVHYISGGGYTKSKQGFYAREKIILLEEEIACK